MKNKLIQQGLLIGVLFLVLGSSLSVLSVNGAIDPPPIEMPRIATYSGYVRNNNGNPLSGAIIAFYSGSLVKLTVSTSSTGYYSFSHEIVSYPKIKASKSDYIPQTITVSSSGGSYNFYLEPNLPVYPTYTGIVKDSYNRVIANAYVQLFSGGEQASTTYTDSNGVYTVGNDIVIGGQLKASKDGYCDKIINVGSNGGTYNLILTFPIYTGTVKDNNNNLIAEAFIQLFSQGVQIGTTYTDSNGAYAVSGNNVVVNGQIKASKAGYYDVTQNVGNNGGSYDFSLIIFKATINGLVFDEETKEVISYATVVLATMNGEILASFVTIYGEYLFTIDLRNEYCYLYVKHNDYFSIDFIVIPNISFTQNFYLKRSLDRPHLIDANDFESQIVGQAPNWDYALGDVRIVNSVGQGLIDYKAGKMVKFSTYANSYTYPELIEYLEPISTYGVVLISFKVAFNSNSDDSFGYFEVKNGYWYFKLNFYRDKITITHPTAYVEFVRNINSNTIYQIDIFLNSGYNQNNQEILNFNIYINNELLKIGVLEAFTSEISLLKFSLNSISSSSSQLYIDDFYCENIGNYITQEEETIAYNLAGVLAWVFAPRVEDILNQYIIKYSSEYTVTLSIGFSFDIKGLSIKATMPIMKLLEPISTNDNRFGIILFYGDPDAIIHISYDFTLTKKILWVPNLNIYFTMFTDMELINAGIKSLSYESFVSRYNWEPISPYDSYQYINSYMESPDGDGAIEVTSQSTVSKYEFSLNIGFFFFTLRIGYSNTLEVERSIYVRQRGTSTKWFEYGAPTDNNALLGMHSYMILNEIQRTTNEDPLISPKPKPILGDLELIMKECDLIDCSLGSHQNMKMLISIE